MVSFKGAHFETTIILTCVRWYLAYPLSYRQLEEDDGGAWCPRGSRHDQSLGPEVQPAIGRGVSPPQAAGGSQLADG